MSMFTKFAALIDAMSVANGYSELFRMSDSQLAARGLSREGLTRSYISGLGAQ